VITTYPKKISEIDPYARKEGIDQSVARQRFAQYALLMAFSYSRELSAALVLKGGNALNAFWTPNRSTKDLDFSMQKAMSINDFEARLNGTFRRVQDDLGIRFRIQTGTQSNDDNPPGGPAFQFIQMRVAFALSGEYGLESRLEAGLDLPNDPANFVPIEIAFGECVCETIPIAIEGQFSLRVCTLEDIMAEKLRSLLQQVTRRTTRKQDVLDLAVILQSRMAFDVQKVSEFLRMKAPVRNVRATKSALKHPDVKERAKVGYDSLKQMAKMFIPFEEAFAMVMGLVDSLSIPDQEPQAVGGNYAPIA